MAFPERGELEYTAKLAPGVTVTWDPATPHGCVDFTVTPDDGHDAQARIADVDRGPWLRLAAVTMFDQRLYLPLDRSLLDAETAAAQLVAARTLRPTESVRECLIGRALIGARRASPGVVSYLKRLAAEGRRPPNVLLAALCTLARCYAALSGEVREYDADLDAVTEAWDELTAIERSVARGRRVVVSPAPAAPQRVGDAQIDPRSVPARVVRLGPTSDAAEISIDPVAQGGGLALRVRVPAFGNESSPGDEADLAVRLIDRRSGQVRAYGLLGQQVADDPPSYGAAAERHFEGFVTLPDALSAPDVRIDLYAITDSEPPRPADGTELGRVRRATLFLSDWRALVADVRVWGVRVAPAERFRAIIRRLGDERSDGSDEPLWAGGPSRSHLLSLADLGDRALTALLRDRKGRSPVPAPSVSGPAELLAAELAAAYERGRDSQAPTPGQPGR